VNDQEVLLGPTALARLRRLAATDAVVSKRELLACMPEGEDEHALEVAVSRLRRSLGSPGLVSTVVKRGYRLNAARDTGAGGGLERDVE
jgi:uroporphyrinogen-III synthase